MPIRLTVLLSFLTVLSLSSVGAQATTANDASCDIAVAPAATLLLPYFEVDLNAASDRRETTIFTVTNVSHMPQIARVTLWTDLAYPVISFNLFLTGYDIASIDLFDVITRGYTGGEVPDSGALSSADNPQVDEATCATQPTPLDDQILTRIQQLLTTGTAPGACAPSGMPHANAVGYATVDVVGSCSSSLPSDRVYFTDDIRYDNVLIGDYVQVNAFEDFAQGGPMVHIRAIPEGGHPRDRPFDPRYLVTAQRTFYDRYQPIGQGRFDARQPLPTVFATRWVRGDRLSFETFFKLWREGIDTSGTCREYARNHLPVIEIVRFDEEENPEVNYRCTPGLPCYSEPYTAPMTSLVEYDDRDFFPRHEEAVSGWFYFNLDDAPNDQVARQGWLVTSMRSEGRYSFDIDATPLGNGCSAPVPYSEAYSGNEDRPIGPLPNRRD